MARWLLALLLMAASAIPAPARDALGTLDACIESLDRGLDIGYGRIAARCPQLMPSLLESPWASWLPADWNKADNQLSAQGLSELRDLLTREPARPAAGRELHVERVAGVLARITQPQAPQQSWWSRLKQWLHGLFTPRAREPGGSWQRLFGELHLGETVVKGIVWGSLALLVALALAVILNELRAAGILGTRPRGAPGAPGVRGDDVRRGGMTFAQIEAASAASQPALLLEFIATRLAEQDRLPPARAFTAQEVTRRARLYDECDRARLAELAGVCERVRFSGRAVAPQVVAGAMARGRELLNALETAAAAAAGAA